MRKIRLKPLAELQQQFCLGRFCVGLLMALCLSACSDDDDNATTPVFPERQAVTCNAGDTKELTFEANEDWELTSSATWCRIVDGVTEEYSLAGKAGKQTITLKITDEAQRFDSKTIAHLTLMMGASKAIIAEVARNAKGFELKLYDETGNEIQAIEVGYNDYKPFKVKANFRFAATNRPEWVEIAGNAIVGTVNKEVTGSVRILNDAKYFKYTQEGTLTFADEKGLASYTFPLVYGGMKRNDINIKSPSQNKWDWTVSLDGKTFTQEGGNNSSSTTFKNSLPFTIEAFNDDFTIVYLEEFNGQFYDDADSWMQLSGEKGSVKLTVSKTDKERTGYVLAFANEEYNAIKGNLLKNIIEDGTIAYRYEQNNLLIQFTQKQTSTGNDDNAQQFKVSNSLSLQPLECTKYTGEDESYFKSQYKVSYIYEVKQPAETLNIDVLFSISTFQCYYYDNEAQDRTGICEQINETSINAVIRGVSRDIFLTVFDESGKGKMLIIRTSNQGGGNQGGGSAPFTVTDNMSSPIACTPFVDTWLVNEYGLDGLFFIASPVKSMNVIPTGTFTITQFQCLDNINLNPVDDVCTLAQDQWTPFNIWLDGISTELFVILSDGTSKYGVIIAEIGQTYKKRVRR